MKNELEDIKGALDTLIARSLAQEAVLLHLAHEMGRKSLFSGEPFPSEEVLQASRYSGLTDFQIQLVGEELQRWHRLLSTVPFGDGGPIPGWD